MEIKHSIKGFELTHEADGTGAKGTIKIEGIDIEIKDLNLKEYVEVIRELPSIIREIRKVTQEDSEAQDFSFHKGYADGYHDGVTQATALKTEKENDSAK